MKQQKISGPQLRKLRLAADISLETMAELTGYTKGYISALELEHFPITAKAHKKILQVLKTVQMSVPRPQNENQALLNSLLFHFDRASTPPQNIILQPLESGTTISGSSTQLSLSCIQLFNQVANAGRHAANNRTIGILTHRPYGFISQIWHMHTPWLNALDALFKQGYEVMHFMDMRYVKPHESLYLLRYLIQFFKNHPTLRSDYKICSFRGSTVSLSHDMYLVPDFGVLLGLSSSSYEMIDSGIYLNDPRQLQILERYFSTLANHAAPMFTFYTTASNTFNEELLAMDTIAYPRHFMSHAFPLAIIEPKQYAARIQRIAPTDPVHALQIELQRIRHHTQLELAKRYAYRFTLEKKWLLRFLQGEVPYPYDYAETPFNQAEALSIVKTIVSLLRSLPKLEICLLDDLPDDLKEFTWYSVDNRVMLMSLPSTDSEGCDMPRVRINIQEKLFVNAFSVLTEKIWSSQPVQNKTKSYVINWLNHAVNLSQ